MYVCRKYDIFRLQQSLHDIVLIYLVFSSKVPLTLYGFAIAATWLDSIADKLVEILELFGILLEIPSTVLGLTVLAFGNSIQGETVSPPSFYETK